MTAAPDEAASLANMDPKDVVTKMWTDIVQDAQKAPISLESLENKKENDKSYFVRFSGVVEQVEVKSKFITVSVNTGNEIIPIQVGSMIKGNAIRDASSLLSFDQFKNQIQYSKLAKELNKSAVQNLVKLDDSSVGKKVDVLSALTIKGDNIQNVVPLDIKIVE